MTKFMLFLMAVFLLPSMDLQSQDLEQHRWNNRLILIFFNDYKDTDLTDQLSEFKNFETGLHERKVLVDQITPDKFKLGWNDQHKWEQASEDLFSKYKITESKFEVLLIGLDGGVKLKAQDPINCEELFRIIDSMPMRQRELQEKNRNQRPH